jgi:transcriptional regulator of acetoin/glycerol metabolism
LAIAADRLAARVDEILRVSSACSAKPAVLGGPEGAAARLGMKRAALHEKIKRLGISRLE